MQELEQAYINPSYRSPTRIKKELADAQAVLYLILKNEIIDYDILHLQLEKERQLYRKYTDFFNNTISY